MKTNIGWFVFVFFSTSLVALANAQWYETATLPAPRWYLDCCAYNGYVYAIGGEQSAAGQNNVWYARIQNDGSLNPWLSTTNLPSGRMYHGSCAYNGYLFVFGGWGSGSYHSTVWSAEIEQDGSIGTWSSTTNMPAPRSCISSAAYNGYLYIVGGYNGSSDYTTVWYAQIDSLGALGPWDSTTNMPAVRRCHGSCAHNGYLYITGGFHMAGVPTYHSEVWYTQIDSTGPIGDWISTTQLLSAQGGHGCCAQNGHLLITGGQDLLHYFSTVWYAEIQGTGQLDPWLSSPNLPETRSGHASCIYDEYIYVMGGTNGSGNLNTVRYARVCSLVGVKEMDKYKIAAKQIWLRANPNIIKNSTRIEYGITNDRVPVNLKLYDSSGRLVYVFVNEKLGKGCYHTYWKPVKSGVYFLSLSTPFEIETAKLLVVK